MEKYYAPKGKYCWDFWVVRVDDTYHLFHLQASRSLHPEARHDHASVGHAISKDLMTWKYQGTALKAGHAGAWDDRCIWTGSILPYHGKFYFLYTARKKTDFLIQRIGLAISDDLYRWEKAAENPVLRADKRWYATHEGGPLKVEDWRDPYLFVHEGKIQVLITARERIPREVPRWQFYASNVRELLCSRTFLGGFLYQDGPRAGKGCIALAESKDFLTWDVKLPLFSPGKYNILECPQLLQHQGVYYLTFSTLKGLYVRKWARTIGRGQTGDHGFWSKSFKGPYHPVNGNGVIFGTSSNRYASRFIKTAGGTWLALSWHVSVPGTRRFCGRLSHPVSMTLENKSMTVTL